MLDVSPAHLATREKTTMATQTNLPLPAPAEDYWTLVARASELRRQALSTPEPGLRSRLNDEADDLQRRASEAPAYKALSGGAG